jgi:hypothetical protein
MLGFSGVFMEVPLRGTEQSRSLRGEYECAAPYRFVFAIAQAVMSRIPRVDSHAD